MTILEKIKDINVSINKDYNIWCCSCGKFQTFTIESDDRPDLICDVCSLVIATLEKIKLTKE